MQGVTDGAHARLGGSRLAFKQIPRKPGETRVSEGSHVPDREYTEHCALYSSQQTYSLKHAIRYTRPLLYSTVV